MKNRITISIKVANQIRLLLLSLRNIIMNQEHLKEYVRMIEKIVDLINEKLRRKFKDNK